VLHRILFHLAQVLLVAAVVVDIAGVGAAYQLEAALWHMLGLVFCAALGIQCFSSYKKSLKKVQYVIDTPTSKIGSAAQGYVELKGRLIFPAGQTPLISPLSHTACLWWEYDISEYRKTSKHSSSWITIDSAQSNDAFYMADETGQCRIHPQNATITAHEQKTWKGNKPHPQQVQKDKESRWKNIMKSFRNYRYTEHFLLPDQELYALGYFQHKNGQPLLEEPKDGRPFILSNQEENQIIHTNRSNARIEFAMIFIASIVAVGIIWHWLR